nr:ABC transporter substrate-binding protein [uncultured Methanospirillum sp.]
MRTKNLTQTERKSPPFSWINLNIIGVLLIISFVLITGVVSAADTKTVTDMREKQVTIPADPQKVVILDKGLIVQTMKALGVEDKIAGSGGILGTSVQSETDLDSVYLIPELLNLGDTGYPFGGEVNYEKVAFPNPDLVILLQSEYTRDRASDQTDAVINRIESMGIPLVVINSPGYYKPVSSNATAQAVTLLGEVFNKKDRASEIVSYLADQEKMISDRTSSIPESKKPSTLYIGLKNESSGAVWGGEYGDAKFSKSIAHIKNVYSKDESVRMSSEQLNKLNPDVIILATNNVEANPDILYTEPYATMREITAIKNKQVGALGRLSWWGEFRLDTPTILLIAAKTVYPDQFADINVYNWLMNHYKELYGLTGDKAEELAKVQKLDWMKEKNF